MSHRESFFSLIKLRIWLYLGIAGLIVIMGIVSVLYFTIQDKRHHKHDLPVDIYQWGTLIAKESDFSLPLIIAQTEVQQECGLSFSSSLPSNTGMLFDFSRTGGVVQHPFWMKDMKYSLDIVWVESVGTVIGIHESVTPESFPETVDVASQSLYVLEVPAGFINTYANSFVIGNSFDIYEADQVIRKKDGPTLCE